MPEQPQLPPLPDALRRSEAPAPPSPKVDFLNDPFNPDPAQPEKTARPDGEEKEKVEQAPSGLSQLDAPHVFASILFSGVGRAAAVILVCILTFGLTDACYRVSLVFEGWRNGGFSGFIGAIFAAPGAIFAAPGRWMASLGQGILEPMGVPYLMLFLGGVILAVRSEIHLARLLIFYAFVGAFHAAGFYKLNSYPFSVICWLAVLAGYVWLYRWYWKQQLQVEEEPAGEEESGNV